MPKNTKSRKGKKAWRKNISDSDVVAYKEKVDKEKRTGGDVTAIEDDALFFMDSKPNESQRPLRSERRAAALKTPLAVDRILSVKSAYKYPVVAAVNKTEPKGVHSIKRKTSEVSGTQMRKLCASTNKGTLGALLYAYTANDCLL
jgi:hypothetical protein